MKFSSFLLLFLFAMQLSSQELATDFSYNDTEGTIGQLSDYQGQVVYISFWASWCQPCISNFKKYSEIRQMLADKGVVLLNVDIDKDPLNWKAALVKHDIAGIHVRGTDLDELQEVYQLYTIPSYEIINKNGYLVYLSDDPNRSIIQEFERWVVE